MATLTSTRAASTFPVFKNSAGAGAVSAAYGSYALTANPTAADIIEFCKVPAGAVILGGWFRAEDIDSDATEEVDIDIGYAANGDVVADPDAFGNFGVLNGDAVTNYLPEGGVLLPLHGTLADRFVTLNKETTIIGTVNVDSATFAAGTVSVVVLYVNP